MRISVPKGCWVFEDVFYQTVGNPAVRSAAVLDLSESNDRGALSGETPMFKFNNVCISSLGNNYVTSLGIYIYIYIYIHIRTSIALDAMT